MPEPADLLERTWISQYSTPVFGHTVYKAGVVADADANDVTVTMVDESDDSVIFSDRSATRVELGVYEVTLSSIETSSEGLYSLTWEWQTDTTPQTYVARIEVGASTPAYDALPAGMKTLIELTWIRLADCFDSQLGGPYLLEKFQANFGRGRMAQLLEIALNRLNASAQPTQRYTADTFPVSTWGGTLEQALYVETLKHLRRAYVEQPDPRQITVAHLDRKDYLNRWSTILGDEERLLAEMMTVYKLNHMGLGQPGILVHGGAYGRYAPVIHAGYLAARPRFYMRYY